MSHKISIFATIRSWARSIKEQTLALYYALQHPYIPRKAKILGTFILAYAFSPIDLIPDFIPVLGFLDEMILLPLLLWLLSTWIPEDIKLWGRNQMYIEYRRPAPVSYRAAVTIVAIWCAVIYFSWDIYHLLS